MDGESLNATNELAGFQGAGAAGGLCGFFFGGVPMNHKPQIYKPFEFLMATTVDGCEIRFSHHQNETTVEVFRWHLQWESNHFQDCLGGAKWISPILSAQFSQYPVRQIPDC